MGQLQQEGYPLKILLKAGKMNERAYYRHLRSMAESEEKVPVKRKGKAKSAYCQKTDGTFVSNEAVLEIIEKIDHDQNRKEAYHYVKVFGDKKLSLYLLDTFGIRCNHKKLYRLRKEAGLVRSYRKRRNHYTRAQEHLILFPNQMWQMDIKYYKTGEGMLQVLSLIDVYDKWVVGTFIGRSVLAADVKETVQRAITYRGISGEGLIIRNDHGCQFTSHTVMNELEDLQILQEFGLLKNPNSQAYVESFHAQCALEFVFESNSIPASVQDFHDEYRAYLKFYHHIRYHGSLRCFRTRRMLTPYQFQKQIHGSSRELPELKVFS